jgi:hypothetical protein
MANGFNRTRLGRQLKSATATRRRLLILGYLAVAGLPGSAELAAQQAVSAPSQPATSTSTAPVAQAIALQDDQAAGAVAQTAGGVLDQIFGSQPAASKSSKDDGRKAYPLPPPDPATVNWSGVPFHRPTPGSAALAAPQAQQPIRDPQSITDSRADLPRRRSGESSLPAGLPQPPDAANHDRATTSARAAAARMAATPLPATKLPSNSVQNELSSNSSSRRSGRRAIEALSPEDYLTSGQEGARNDFHSVARRQVPHADLPISPQAPSIPADLPAPAATAPLTASVPPSLSSIDARIAAQQPELNATIPPVARPTETPSAETSGAEMALSDVTNLEPPKNADAPVSAPQEITAQLSPERTADTEGESTSETPNAYIGSGIVTTLTPLSPASPGADAEFAELESPTTSLPLSPFVGSASDPVDQRTGALVVSEPAKSGELADFVARRPDSAPAEISQRPDDLGQLHAQGQGAPKRKQLGASELPGIRVVTEGPSEILIRELTQYEVRVENRGSFDASGVVVRTALPPWAEVQGHNASGGTVTPISTDAAGKLEWTISSLPAGVVERLFVRVKPVQSGAFDVDTSWTTTPVAHTAQVMVREPKLAIHIDGPDEVVFGQSQKYRVRVLNPGDAAASNVLFTLVPEAGDAINQAIGSIPAGKEASFDIELTARDLEQLKINGTVTADLDLTATANKSVSVSAAMIEATLSGPPLKFQNSDAAYQLQLTNRGRAVSDAVTGEIQLPKGMRYLEGIDGASVQGDRLLWTIGALPPGQSREYTFTCKMEQTGNHAITFHCTGSAAGQASVAIDTAVQAIVDLKLAVIDPPAPAPVGEEVFYEIMINNRGSKAAEDVRVVAQFGNGIEPIRVEGHSGDVITGQVLFNPIPRIDADKQFKLRVAAKADRAGDHRFRAEVRSGETVLVAEEATLFVDVQNERVSRSSSEPARR